MMLQWQGLTWYTLTSWRRTPMMLQWQGCCWFDWMSLAEKAMVFNRWVMHWQFVLLTRFKWMQCASAQVQNKHDWFGYLCTTAAARWCALVMRCKMVLL
jgi:hypothetical protein